MTAVQRSVVLSAVAWACFGAWGCGFHLSLSPSFVSLSINQTKQFVVDTAFGDPADLSQVVWDPEAGTVDPKTGIYTAPDIAGTYLLTVLPLTDGAYFGEGASEPATISVLPLGLSPN